METDSHLANVWDCHVHLFNPKTLPYKPSRAYTPPEATPAQLVGHSSAHNFMIVQATVEDGPAALLHHLESCSRQFPTRRFRGTILYGLNEHNNPEAWAEAPVQQLHNSGVRCLRIHGKFGDVSRDGNATERIKILLMSACGVARLKGWAISMQLPLIMWAALADFLEQELHDIPVIAEHCASINVPLSSVDTTAFETVCGMLQRKLIYVKLGALHRRATSQCMDQLTYALSTMARHGDGRLLWGSDWPHVDSSAQGVEEADFLRVDARAELDLIQSSLAECPSAVEQMLTVTPQRLFT